jgi:oligoribonuclease
MSNSYFIIDVETTGIDPHTGRLLSVGVVALNSHFEPIEVMEVNIGTTQEDLQALCNSTVTKMHMESGVWLKCLESQTTTSEAETMVAEFIKRYSHPNANARRYLVNNSVHFDYHWLLTHMPNVAKLLYRRLIDVSTIHVLLQVFQPDVAKRIEQEKTFSHSALTDCLETLGELKFYITKLFKKD